MSYDIYNLYEPYPHDTPEERARTAQRVARQQEIIREILPRLRPLIEDPDRDPGDVAQVLKPYHLEARDTPMTPEDLPEIQALCRLVLEKGGLAQNRIQDFLLRLVGHTATREAVPFLLEVLHFSRRGDQFGPERRQLALWGLARIARLHGVPAAYAALDEGLADRHPDVRLRTVDLIVSAYLAADRDVPPEVVAKLRELAASDPDDYVRHGASRALRDRWARELAEDE